MNKELTKKTKKRTTSVKMLKAPDPADCKKSDEMDKVAEFLWEAFGKMQKAGIDPGYARYLVFSITGCIVIRLEGTDVFHKYVNEIK